MVNFRVVSIVFVFVLLLLAPDLATAQSDGGLVTCTGLDCDFCNFATMVDNIIDFLVTLLIIIATIILAITGLQMAYTAAGGGEAREILKDRMTNIIIGFILIIASWVLVDTLLKALVTDDLANNWRTPTEDLCFGQTDPGEPVFGREATTGAAARGDSGQNSGYQGGIGSGVEPTGNLVNYNGRQFDSTVVDKVRALHEKFPGLQLTSGYRSPSQNAAANGSPTSYHLEGRAADFVGSESDMQAAANWARANGAVEVLMHNAGSGRHLHVAW